jgi:hypothetical protein
VPRILLALLLAIPLRAAEFAVAPPRTAPAPGVQSFPVIATNGRDFLVAWTDQRLGGSTFARRVTASGEPLDGNGILLQRASLQLGAVWTGRDYALIGADRDAHLWAARIDASGAIVQPPHDLASNAFLYGHYTLATNGRAIVAAYHDRTSNRAHAAVLDLDTRLVSDTVLPATQPSSTHIATDGNAFLVTWRELDSGQISGVRLDADGALVDSAPRLLVPTPVIDDYALVSNGATYLAAGWSRESIGLHIAEIAPDLRVVDSSDVGAAQTLSPSLAWDGARYTAVWAQITATGSTVYTRHLDAHGAALDATTELAGGDDRTPFVAANPAATYAAFEELRSHRFQDLDVRGKLLGGSGSTLLSTSAATQTAPSLAWNGRAYVAAWLEQNGDAFEPWLTQSAPDGTAAPAVCLAPDAVASPPRVTADLAVWTESDGTASTIRYVRLDASGAPSGAAQSLPDLTAGEIDVARDVIVWNAFGATHPLRATRIDRNGNALTVDIPGATHTQLPRIAWNGSTYLVAWDQLTPIGTLIGIIALRTDVEAMRLSPELTPLDPAPIAIEPPNPSTSASIAANGREWLVAYVALGSPLAVTARWLAPDGTLLDRLALSTNGVGASPSATWSGIDYAVSWHESYVNGMNVRMTRTLRGGGRSAPALLTAGPTTQTTSTSALASAGNGSLLAAYAHVVLTPEVGGVARLFVRPIDAPRRMRAIRQ